jgi:mono/diheme cytochrome c family protein
MVRLPRSACGILIAFSAIAFSLGLILIPPAASDLRGNSTPSKLVFGKRLYRQYCGQCHALSAALSAGFGNSSGGLGQDGGPSFNSLRVPYIYSVDAVSEPTGGHELVRLRLTMGELSAVATFIAKTTVGNPIPALPTDG